MKSERNKRRFIMKNKKKLGVAAASLALVAAIGATAGTTLAKYISSAKVESQSATVARWGFTISANTDKMFSDEYGNVDKTNSLAKADGKTGIVVRSTTGDKLVAPGTTGQMTFTVNGTAQVNAILTLDFSFINTETFETVVLSDKGELNYYPIVWSVGREAINVDNEGNASKPTVADFADGVEKAFAEKEGVTVGRDEKGHVLVFIQENASVADVDLTISWKWNFTDGTPTKDEATNETNIKDTLLGSISAGMEYEGLGDNVKAWLYKNYKLKLLENQTQTNVSTTNTALETAKKNLTDGQAAYESAVETHNGFVKAFEEAKDALDKAQVVYDNAYIAFERLKEQGITEGEEFKNAEKAVQDASDALTPLQTALDSAKADLAANEKVAEFDGDTDGAYTAAVKLYDGLVSAVKTAQDAYDAAVKAAVVEYYELLKTESKTHIEFSFEAVIAQTLLTQAEFVKAYPATPVEP